MLLFSVALARWCCARSSASGSTRNSVFGGRKVRCAPACPVCKLAVEVRGCASLETGGLEMDDETVLVPTVLLCIELADVPDGSETGTPTLVLGLAAEPLLSVAFGEMVAPEATR